MNRQGKVVKGACYMLMLGSVLFASGCARTAEDITPNSDIVAVEPEVESIPMTRIEDTATPIIEKTRLAITGDIMYHKEQIWAGDNDKDGVYQFDYMFEPVAPYLSDADLTIGNLELTLAGEDRGGYTGYPCFNAPEQLAEALKQSGFDVVTTANNHSLDRRFYGVEHTLEVLDEQELLHTGTYATQEASEDILIIQSNGIDIALLSYTYGTNGISFEEGKEYSVNMIDKEKIVADLERTKALAPDVIAVSMHWGAEYVRSANDTQKDLTDLLFEHGVDLIFGSHPHVLQPMETRTVNVDGKDKEVFVIYSLGNFISTQRDRYKDTGIILYLDIEHNLAEGQIHIAGIEYLPIWVDLSRIEGGDYHFRVLPIRKAMADYEVKSDPLLTAKDYTKLETALSDITTMYESFKEYTITKDEQIKE